MKSRAHLWQQLDKTLRQIAHRSILVLGGDFNTPLAGHGNSPTKPPLDTLEFSGLVKKYRLGSVRTHDGGPTFIGTQGASTIDFVFLRQIQFDPARQGKCLRDTPLACWREVPDHFPILSSISLGWTCWHAKKPLASRFDPRAHVPGVEPADLALADLRTRPEPPAPCLPTCHACQTL